jgi:hypothetical protein
MPDFHFRDFAFDRHASSADQQAIERKPAAMLT